jgi:hypothetical protein
VEDRQTIAYHARVLAAKGSLMSIRSNAMAASAALLSMFAALPAHAGVTPVPEPGTWSLVGLALVIGVAVMRNRRK